jgi:hypothetical protein
MYNLTTENKINEFYTNINTTPYGINMKDVSSPLEQFEIRDLLSIDAPIFFNIHLSITNIGIYLTIASVLLLFFNLLANNNNKIIVNG